MRTLNSKQRRFLETYLKLFNGMVNGKYKKLKDGVDLPDEVTEFYSLRVKIILNEGKYEEMDRKRLNEQVVPMVKQNKQWLIDNGYAKS